MTPAPAEEARSAATSPAVTSVSAGAEVSRGVPGVIDHSSQEPW